VEKERRLALLMVGVIVIFASYISILYFGHQVVPNPDFTGFVNVGRQILSFKMPTGFKRAPVLGILQVLLSYVVRGNHPELTAGWLLNAILNPLNAVLIYLVGRHFIGRAAVWAALITIINPWVIAMLVQPLVETTLLFFILLTFWLMLRRSKWCYLSASVATMVRYEGAALIAAAFVLDLIYAKNRKEKILGFVYSALASIPLMLWMLGTLFSNTGGTHYFSVFKSDYFGDVQAKRTGIGMHMRILWETGFQPLLAPYFSKSRDFLSFCFGLNKTAVAVGCFSGVIFGLLRRQWALLGLLVFFIPYFVLHAVYPFPFNRFHMPILWIALVICVYGYQSVGAFIAKTRFRLSGFLMTGLLILIILVSLVWTVLLLDLLPYAASVSSKSTSVPYVALGVVGAIYLIRRLYYKMQRSLRDLAVSGIMCLFVISNQFTLVGVVGNGRGDIEFKMLADWCRENTQPGDKTVSTLYNVARIFVPDRADDIVPMGGIDANSPGEFIKKCYEKDITYVTWDSRIGLNPDNEYYRIWGIKNIAFLGAGRSIEPYEFVTQIRASDRRFINVFRLKRSPTSNQ
jgi:4-amino-4-deoxy-L-arabinose transferase-like glycosyltransferase